MRQAIITKYIGPTDNRPSRIKVTADVGSITYSWDHALDCADNHRVAAESYARTKGWLDGHMLVGGGMPQSTPYAYCFVLVPIPGPPVTHE